MNADSNLGLPIRASPQPSNDQIKYLRYSRALTFRFWLVACALSALVGCLGDGDDTPVLPFVTQSEQPLYEPYEGRAVLGPLVGARVEVYELGQHAGVPIFVTTTADAEKVQNAGKFLVEAELEPEALYVIRVVGGVDIDPDDDGARDELPLASLGTVHALATGAQIAAGDYRVSAATEALFQSLKYGLATGAPVDALMADANARAPALIANDITGDVKVDLSDVNAWDPLIHARALSPTSAIVRALIDDVHNGRSTTENGMRLASGALGSLDLAEHLPHNRALDVISHYIAPGPERTLVAEVSCDGGRRKCRRELVWLRIGGPQFLKIFGVERLEGHLNDRWISSLHLLESEHAIIVEGTQLQILDVSAPSKAISVAEFQFVDWPDEFVTQGAIGVAQLSGQSNYLQIIDFAIPESPRTAARLDLPFPANHVVFALHSTRLYALITVQRQLAVAVVDISDPYLPVWQDTVELPVRIPPQTGPGAYMAASDTLLAISIGDEFASDNLFVFDIDESVDGDSLRQMRPCGDGSPIPLQIASRRVMFRCGPDLVTISVPDDESVPTLTTYYYPWGWWFATVNNTLMVPAGKRRIDAIDLRRLQPTLVSKSAISWEVGGLESPGEIAVTPQEALVANKCEWDYSVDCGEIIAIDLSSRKWRRVADHRWPYRGTLHTDNGIVLFGDNVFKWIPGQRLVLVSRLPDPIVTRGRAWLLHSAALSGTLAAIGYVVHFDDELSEGLQFMDMSDPTSPVVVGATDPVKDIFRIRWGELFVEDPYTDVVLQPPFAFVVGERGLLVWRVTTGSGTFPLLGKADIPEARALALAGKEAFILANDTTGWSKLYTVSLTDMTKPKLTNEMSLGGSLDSRRTLVQWQGFVYAATSGEGLKVLDVNNPHEPELFGTVQIEGKIEAIERQEDRLYVTTSDGRFLVIKAISPQSTDLTWLH